MKKYFLVTDFGSSSVRTLILSASGEIEFISRKEFSPCYDGDRIEYDPVSLIESFRNSLSEALKKVQSAEILSFAVACQRSSFIIWDKISGLPLTPVISWQDGRAKDVIAGLKISNSRIHSITGLYKTPYYSAPKIRFCIESDPKVADAFKRKKAAVGPVATYALWSISGGRLFVIDPTLAQRTLLFNIKRMKWEPCLMKLFGVPPDALPDVVPTFQKRLKLELNGREIILGGIIGDQQAAAMPFISEKEKAVVNYGTGAFLLTSTGREIVKIKGLLNSVAFTSENDKCYLLESTVNSCGTFLQWLNLKFGLGLKLDDIDNVIKKSRNRMFVLPSIGGIGSPYWDYDTLTTFSGFTVDSDSNDIVRSSVEGIAFFIADGLEEIRKKIKISSLTASGGLSHLDYLAQFQSDITGLPVYRRKDSEATAMGLGRALALREEIPTGEWKSFKTDKEYQPLMSEIERSAVFSEWKLFFNSTKKMYQKRKSLKIRV